MVIPELMHLMHVIKIQHFSKAAFKLQGNYFCNCCCADWFK